MADVSVRPARPEDAAELGRIQVLTWRTAYASILPAAVLDSLSEDDAATAWREAIVAPPTPRHRVLVALEQEWLVGFAAVGPADDLEAGDPEPEATVTVAPILVEPRWGRRGHGSRLLSATVDLWREDGFTHAVAWAYEQDKATQKFLTSAGWSPDGAGRALDVDDMLVPQLRLHADVSAELPS